MAVWTLVGNEENWRTALRQGYIWGVKPGLKSQWGLLKVDDHLLFYCKSPIGGLIGVGTLAKTFIQDKPFWPDEEKAGRVIYPYRFEMNLLYVLPEGRWKSDPIKGSFVGLSRGFVAKGLNPIHNPEVLLQIEKALTEKFGVRIRDGKKEPREPPLDHSGIQEMLVELGSLQRFLSQKEYPMGRERLDVAWRRVEGSVPTYVFEVQVGGDLVHALSKLKHAYDIWNSNVILAAGPGDVSKAEALLSGAFHEVHDKVRLIELSKIQELYRLKKQWKSLEKSIGIF